MRSICPLYTVTRFINRKQNKSHAHNEYLYRQWTNPIIYKRKTMKSYTIYSTKILLAIALVQDDPSSIKPTLSSICTLDICSSHQTTVNAYVLIC